MNLFDLLQALITDPDTGDVETPAHVQRLLIRATRAAPDGVAGEVSALIDAFDADFRLLFAGALIAGGHRGELSVLQDSLSARLARLRVLSEDPVPKL